MNSNSILTSFILLSLVFLGLSTYYALEQIKVLQYQVEQLKGE